MDEKLGAWMERITHAPVDSPEYEEFVELLIECRILEMNPPYPLLTEG